MVDNNADITEIITTNLTAVIFLIRSISWTIQAKNPASLRSPTKTIIPTKKSITSKEANLITFSMLVVLVIKRTDVPKKTNPRRKSQKKSVPKTETENMDMAVD